MGSFIDYVTAKIYRPVMVMACMGIAIALTYLLFPDVLGQFTHAIATIQGAFSAAVFILMLMNRKARDAIDAYNRHVFSDIETYRKTQKEVGFFQKYIGVNPTFPDPMLQVIMKSGFIVVMISAFANRFDAALLAFLSSWMAGIMALLRLPLSGWGSGR